jgi:hypothetical protein
MKPHSAADCDRTMVSVDTVAGCVREFCVVVLMIAPLLIVAGNTARSCNSTGPAHDWRIASRNRDGEQMPISLEPGCLPRSSHRAAPGTAPLMFGTGLR